MMVPIKTKRGTAVRVKEFEMFQKISPRLGQIEVPFKRVRPINPVIPSAVPIQSPPACGQKNLSDPGARLVEIRGLRR